MKIVVIKPPKLFCGILKKLFGVGGEKEYQA